MTIKITLRADHPSWPPWKLAEASLLFHAEDGLLAGLTLRGFTIGTSRYEGKVNITVPSRTYDVPATDPDTGVVGTKKETFTYLVPTLVEFKEPLPRLLKAIEAAYQGVIRATEGAA